MYSIIQYSTNNQDFIGSQSLFIPCIETMENLPINCRETGSVYQVRLATSEKEPHQSR